MKKIIFSWLVLLAAWQVKAQESDVTSLLRIILEQSYKNEKPVFKNRSQLLYFYCTQANNTGELIEATQKTDLPQEFIQEIKIKINQDTAERSWSNELETIFANNPTQLKLKVKECVELEKYQEVSTRLHLNNQRLLIVSKPLIYSKGNLALVKVVYYRNIEHNSSSIWWLEKKDGLWVLKQKLNSWTT
ncbi:hypothetical protein KIH23_03405 [Flavobacterium sp. CYK-55]|uniref:hypothetical protein n=1 Tax=Flavobacterium sp. CYK-55 TaxID=2835529 RepID=UPI001BD12578|nr:hypothetical protein [Flavobacterium sp. CYK-55]MBS7786332.1 hypothetical protein [Flavobacterium sp. CYK-55]